MSKDPAVVEKPTTTGATAVNGAIPHNTMPPFTIDALYRLDGYLEPVAVKPVSSLNDPVPFAPDAVYRVYFDQCDTCPESALDDDLPHADIFIQSDGQLCIEYAFLPTAIPEEVENIEESVKTRAFLRAALKRWGGFTLLWGGPECDETYEQGANMLLYYDDELAFVTFRRIGVPSGTTFEEVLSDYLFLSLEAAMLE
jgi:hypothetical protein